MQKLQFLNAALLSRLLFAVDKLFLCWLVRSSSSVSLIHYFAVLPILARRLSLIAKRAYEPWSTRILAQDIIQRTCTTLALTYTASQSFDEPFSPGFLFSLFRSRNKTRWIQHQRHTNLAFLFHFLVVVFRIPRSFCSTPWNRHDT